MIKSLLQVLNILRWHKRTFPKFTFKDQQLKLAGEIREWNEAIEDFIRTGQDRHREHAEEELADVVIAATNLYRYPEMRQLVAGKMLVNRNRTWHKGHHK